MNRLQKTLAAQALPKSTTLLRYTQNLEAEQYALIAYHL
jgi:hypothetical protein